MKITIPLACLRNDVLERADCGNDFSDTLQLNPVSYTHLDVYKRQVLNRACEAYGDYLKEEANNKDDEYEEGEEE